MPTPLASPVTACYDRPPMDDPAIPGGVPGFSEYDAEQRLAEQRLVERAAAGDAGAFETLYRRHLGRVYALCLRMAGNRREAEEYAQDAFVRAWKKLDTYNGRAAFGTWLHRLTVNSILGAWRSRSRREQRVVAIDDLDAAGSRPPEESVAATAEPRNRLDLERAIAALPRGARTVFVLFDIEGYSHDEIARLTGLAVGTSKAQLHRARKLLRETLSS